MMGTVGAPTLIDLCCSEPTEMAEMACCAGDEGESEDEGCCETELTFDSIDGQSHKAESQTVDTPSEHIADVLQQFVVKDDKGLQAAPNLKAIPPPTSPTQSFLGVYRL